MDAINMSQPANFTAQDSAIINEILNDPEPQNNNNGYIYDRNTDIDSTVLRNGLPPPTPEQLQELNMLHYQNTQQNSHQEHQELQEQQYQSPLSQEQIQQGYKKNENNTYNNFKDVLVVMILFFLFSLFPFNKYIGKIPMMLDTFGKVTILGNILITLFIGILYFIYLHFIK